MNMIDPSDSPKLPPRTNKNPRYTSQEMRAFADEAERAHEEHLTFPLRVEIASLTSEVEHLTELAYNLQVECARLRRELAFTRAGIAPAPLGADEVGLEDSQKNDN